MLSAILIFIAIVAILVGYNEYKRYKRVSEAKKEVVAGIARIQEKLKDLSDSIDEEVSDNFDEESEEANIFNKIDDKEIDGFIVGDEVIVTDELSPMYGCVGKIDHFIELHGSLGAGIDFGQDFGITHRLEGSLDDKHGWYERLSCIGVYIKEKPAKKKTAKKATKKVAKKKTSKKSK